MNHSKDNKSLFATTHWTMVLRAGGNVTRDVVDALEYLCGTYWIPLYSYVRGRGNSREDSEDLVQGFFASLLKHRDFSKLNGETGKFRAFLLASMKHYIINEYRHSNRIKRGGGVEKLSLDWARGEQQFEIVDKITADPKDIYDRQWALTLLERVLERLRLEWSRKGKAEEFEIMKNFLTVDRDKIGYDEIASKLLKKEESIRVSVHRLRKKYRMMLKDEIAQTLSMPEMIEEELQTLITVLSRAGD